MSDAQPPAEGSDSKKTSAPSGAFGGGFGSSFSGSTGGSKAFTAAAKTGASMATSGSAFGKAPPAPAGTQKNVFGAPAAGGTKAQAFPAAKGAGAFGSTAGGAFTASSTAKAPAAAGDGDSAATPGAGSSPAAAGGGGTSSSSSGFGFSKDAPAPSGAFAKKAPGASFGATLAPKQPAAAPNSTDATPSAASGAAAASTGPKALSTTKPFAAAGGFAAAASGGSTASAFGKAPAGKTPAPAGALSSAALAPSAAPAATTSAATGSAAGASFEVTSSSSATPAAGGSAAGGFGAKTQPKMMFGSHSTAGLGGGPKPSLPSSTSGGGGGFASATTTAAKAGFGSQPAASTGLGLGASAPAPTSSTAAAKSTLVPSLSGASSGATLPATGGGTAAGGSVPSAGASAATWTSDSSSSVPKPQRKASDIRPSQRKARGAPTVPPVIPALEARGHADSLRLPVAAIGGNSVAYFALTGNTAVHKDVSKAEAATVAPEEQTSAARFGLTHLEQVLSAYAGRVVTPSHENVNLTLPRPIVVRAPSRAAAAAEADACASGADWRCVTSPAHPAMFVLLSPHGRNHVAVDVSESTDESDCRLTNVTTDAPVRAACFHPVARTTLLLLTTIGNIEVHRIPSTEFDSRDDTSDGRLRHVDPCETSTRVVQWCPVDGATRQQPLPHKKRKSRGPSPAASTGGNSGHLPPAPSAGDAPSPQQGTTGTSSAPGTQAPGIPGLVGLSLLPSTIGTPDVLLALDAGGSVYACDISADIIVNLGNDAAHKASVPLTMRRLIEGPGKQVGVPFCALGACLTDERPGWFTVVRASRDAVAHIDAVNEMCVMQTLSGKPAPSEKAADSKPSKTKGGDDTHRTAGAKSKNVGATQQPSSSTGSLSDISEIGRETPAASPRPAEPKRGSAKTSESPDDGATKKKRDADSDKASSEKPPPPRPTRPVHLGTILLADESERKLWGVDLQPGLENSQNMFVVSVTPLLSPQVPEKKKDTAAAGSGKLGSAAKPIGAAGDVPRAMPALRLRRHFLLCIPVWSLKRHAWVYGTGRALEEAAPVSFEAGEPPMPLAVALPPRRGGYVLDGPSDTNRFPDEDPAAEERLGLDTAAPVLCSDSLAYIEPHSLPGTDRDMLRSTTQNFYMPLQSVLLAANVAAMALPSVRPELSSAVRCLSTSEAVTTALGAVARLHAAAVRNAHHHVAQRLQLRFEAPPPVEREILKEARQQVEAIEKTLVGASQKADSKATALRGKLNQADSMYAAAHKSVTDLLRAAEFSRIHAKGPAALHDINTQLAVLDQQLQAVEAELDTDEARQQTTIAARAADDDDKVEIRLVIEEPSPTRPVPGGDGAVVARRS